MGVEFPLLLLCKLLNVPNLLNIFLPKISLHKGSLCSLNSAHCIATPKVNPRVSRLGQTHRFVAVVTKGCSHFMITQKFSTWKTSQILHSSFIKH